MLLDSYLPHYFVREVNHFAVRTSPAQTYQAISDFDMTSVSWIRYLFQLRTIFDRHPKKPFQLSLHDAYKGGAFVRLQEIPNEELVVGAIGKIWRPLIFFEKVEPQDFSSFHKSGFGKVAWSLRCRPRLGGGTLVTFEVRVGATDVVSALKMRSYFAVIGPFSRAIRRSIFNRLSRELGNIFADEADISLPGDWIVQNPEGSATHGITIEAPVEFVWPWLTQMGCRRAGWYSYDWLDNAGIPSSHRIVSEWQELKEGDILPATPAGEFGFHVVEAKPPNFLILGLCVDRDSGRTLHPNIGKLPRNYSRTTWVFVLEPQTKDISRLVVRVRTDSADNNSGLRNKILMKQIHNFMEEKQIRNLKERAEQMYLAVQAKNDLFKDLGEFSINDSEGGFDSFSNVKRMQG